MSRGGIFLLAMLLATVGCAGTPSRESTAVTRRVPAAGPATSPPGRVVVVAPGDTLVRIAREHGVSVDEIVEVNGLVSADAVRAGQRLFLPAGIAPPAPEAAEDAEARAAEPSLGPAATADLVAPEDSGPTPSLPSSPSPAPLRWPVEGVVLRGFTSAQPATTRRPARDPYEALLIAAPAGTPVRAAATGVVAFAGSQGTTNGTLVVLEHAEGLVTIYAHLHSVAVNVGQTIAAGDVVGEVGTSGLVGASPRVQFQVRRGQAPLDPLPMLPP
jgi:murein DD-endopeptidase MepM/ murein hydrolase activator NlpD